MGPISAEAWAFLVLLYGVEKAKRLAEQIAAGIVKTAEDVARWCAKQDTDDRWNETLNPMP